jgi:RNA polymerase sigma factor (sigma-70 family)
MAVSTSAVPAESNETDAAAPAAPAVRRRGRRSDRGPLTKDQQNLAARYVPLAHKLAKPMKKNWPREHHDFESAALMALVEAARSFDESRNVKFSTFVRIRIWGALRDVQRKLIVQGYQHDPETAPLIQPLSPDAEERGMILNTQPDPRVGREIEAEEVVEFWLRKLPSKHAAVCREIYLNDRSLAQAADKIGCSKSYLCTLHKESLAILEEHMDEYVREGGLNLEYEK